jgi:hypothetical protein
MGTVIQYPQRSNAARQQRWERLERAEQFERYGELKAQGMSQRQVAKVLDCPAVPCRPGGHIKRALMSIPQSWRFFTAFLVSPSCIA